MTKVANSPTSLDTGSRASGATARWDFFAPGSRRGLTSAEVAERLRLEGPNVLPPKRPVPLWRRIGAQLVHFFAVMLWVAGALAILVGMPQLGVAIFAVVLLNGFFSFLQEYRAERASEKLHDLLPRRATVFRDSGLLEVDPAGLVTGDFVVLRGGDRISADLELTEAHALAVDTSTLTGESVPATPQPGEQVFAGTFVVEGEGAGIVVATGEKTRLAEIAQITQAEHRPQTPLARELDRLSKIIALVAVVVGVIFLLIAVLVGIRLRDGLLFAIGVTVALVPEGLLPTVTLALAMGAQRMARRHALVRRLESVETLGSTTFICTDKTGTLTLNQMAVVQVWTPAGWASIEGAGYEPTGTVHAEAPVADSIREVARVAVRCSVGRAVMREGKWVAHGNPLDAAIDVLARRLGVDAAADEVSRPASRRFPFDPRRRRMSVLAGGELLVRGAPESVLPRCRGAGDAEQALKIMTERGLRVIAAAVRKSTEGCEAAGADEIESELELLGLVGIEDPPRPGVQSSIEACRQGGIRVAMVTGDHPATARAIAQEVGLLGADQRVLEGRELPQDEELLGALVDRDGIVISRVTPEEKLRIARALRKRGHVVAMTGDGVNDGPALQEASIGIAMGLSGTDVAREAADLVLLDDNFETIVAAIVQGRTTFANARRFLTYHLTDNVAELTPFVVWALSGGRFPLALGVLQVLSLDIGTDILPALALGAEPPGTNVLRTRPAGRHLLDRKVLLRAFGLLGPVESVIEMLAFLVPFWLGGWRPGAPFPHGHALLAASGAAFSAVVIGQMANAFACRSTTRWPGALGWRTNPFLLGAVAAELLLLVSFLYLPPLARLLGHAPPSRAGFGALLAFPAVLVADAVNKWLSRRRVLKGVKEPWEGAVRVP
jgi:magnesium-transporting ATPase (P-type)